MAPEQVRADECDGQSDLFSLGAVMYALAVGKPPFRADTLYGMMQRIVHDEPRGIRATNPAIPDWREAFILRLHAKDRRDRFASAAEAAAILEAELIPLQHPGAMAPPPRDWWIRPRQGIFTPCRPLAVAVPGAFLIAQPPVAVPETLPPGAVQGCERRRHTRGGACGRPQARRQAVRGSPTGTRPGTGRLREPRRR